MCQRSAMSRRETDSLRGYCCAACAWFQRNRMAWFRLKLWHIKRNVYLFSNVSAEKCSYSCDPSYGECDVSRPSKSLYCRLNNNKSYLRRGNAQKDDVRLISAIQSTMRVQAIKPELSNCMLLVHHITALLTRSLPERSIFTAVPRFRVSLAEIFPCFQSK